MGKRILIVDDEKDIRDLLSYNLTKEGYEILIAVNGPDALEQAKKKPDLILLDVMMPQMDGFEVMRQLHRENLSRRIPVVFLTAKGSEIDEVVGLELGADDYVVKPIAMSKLIARIKTVLRRRIDEGIVGDTDQIIRFETFELDVRSYQVHINGSVVPMTKKEFETLLLLIRNKGSVLSRDQILSSVWGESVVVIDRTIDVHIRRIREKIGRYADRLETVKGVGYRFRTED